MKYKIGDELLFIGKKDSSLCNELQENTDHIIITDVRSDDYIYKAYTKEGEYIGHCSGHTDIFSDENIDKYFKPLNTKNTTMPSIKSIYKALKRGEPEKTFVTVGIMDDNEELTETGKELFTDFLFKKHANDFKKEVADEILAEMEKEAQ